MALRQRDSQRHKLYRAERASGLHDSERIELVPAIGKWVNGILSSKRAREHYPHLKDWFSPVEIKDGRGCRTFARGGASSLVLPKWARNEGVILHELAHCVHLRNREWRHEPFHGWRFAGIFLKLVLWHMGRDSHDKLKAAFKAGRVKFREPRKAGVARPKGVLPEGLRRYMELKKQKEAVL
jgi:hypothetical protein